MFTRTENSSGDYAAAPTMSASPSATATATAPSRVELVKQSIEDVRHKMSGVIEKALETTEKIEDLENETTKLAIQADLFKKNAKKAKNREWWRNSRVIIWTGTAVVLILAVVVVVAIV